MIIFDIINWIVKLFKWVAFAGAVAYIIVSVNKLLTQKRLKICEWVLLVLFFVYILLCIFAPDVISVLWCLLIAVGNIFADYDDKRHGRKWWNWW